MFSKSSFLLKCGSYGNMNIVTIHSFSRSPLCHRVFTYSISVIVSHRNFRDFVKKKDHFAVEDISLFLRRPRSDRAPVTIAGRLMIFKMYPVTEVLTFSMFNSQSFDRAEKHFFFFWQSIFFFFYHRRIAV